MAPFLSPTGVVLPLAFSLFQAPNANHAKHRAQPPSPYLRSAARLAAHEVSSRDTHRTEEETFSRLCHQLNVNPTGLLSLESNGDKIRGIYLNAEVKKDDVLLSIPLASCLRDDMPPSWMGTEASDDEEESYYISPWPARLAASLLDLQLRKANKVGKMWLSMLPDRRLLRASLPIHWPEEIISSTKCTALEVAVDSSYFSRAGAVADLLKGLKGSDIILDKYTDEELMRLCHDSLDVVQTRCCGVQCPDGTGRKLRVIAPIFDFFNHGSGTFPRAGCPNASFAIENVETSEGAPSLVVRATKDIRSSDEVLIDYGGSARTAWKCLVSYGFVPEFEEGDEQNTAELYMAGTRVEVRDGSIPCDLVKAATSALKAEDKTESLPEGADVDEEIDESALSPAVALWIAEKASDVASELLVEPDIDARKEDAYSLSLATSLRKLQHRVLSKWASELKEFATMSD